MTVLVVWCAGLTLAMGGLVMHIGALREDVEWLCDQERRRHALELDARRHGRSDTYLDRLAEHCVSCGRWVRNHDHHHLGINDMDGRPVDGYLCDDCAERDLMDAYQAGD